MKNQERFVEALDGFGRASKSHVQTRFSRQAGISVFSVRIRSRGAFLRSDDAMGV